MQLSTYAIDDCMAVLLDRTSIARALPIWYTLSGRKRGVALIERDHSTADFYVWYCNNEPGHSLPNNRRLHQLNEYDMNHRIATEKAFANEIHSVQLHAGPGIRSQR